MDDPVNPGMGCLMGADIEAEPTATAFISEGISVRRFSFRTFRLAYRR